MVELKKVVKKFPQKCKILRINMLSIFLKYKKTNKEKELLVPMLFDIKNKFGSITESDVICISEYFDIPENTIMDVIKSISDLEIAPVKQHLIKVCMGVACSKCGAEKILEKACKKLKIVSVGVTGDKKIKLESVECMGLCEIAPVVKIDEVYYGKIDESDIESLIEHERQKAND